MRSVSCLSKIQDLARHDVPTDEDVAAAKAVVTKYLSSKKQDATLGTKQFTLLAESERHGRRVARLMACALAPHALPGPRAQTLLRLGADARSAAQRKDWPTALGGLLALARVSDSPAVGRLQEVVRCSLRGDRAGTYATLTTVLGEATDRHLDGVAEALASAALSEDMVRGTDVKEWLQALPIPPRHRLGEIFLDAAMLHVPELVAPALHGQVEPTQAWAAAAGSLWLGKATNAILLGNWARARDQLRGAVALHERSGADPVALGLSNTLLDALEARLGGALVPFYIGLETARVAAEAADQPQRAKAIEDAMTRSLRRDMADVAHAPHLAAGAAALCSGKESVLTKHLVAAAASADCAQVIDALLDVGVGQPPEQPIMRGGRDAWLRKATQWRWDLAAYTFSAGADLFVHAPNPAMIRPSYAYEICQTPSTRILSHLTRISEGNWEICGMSVDAVRHTTYFLVRTGVERQRDYQEVRHTDVHVAVAEIEARGASVSAYAQRH
ncbi:MAG TPA: hypothetical protein VFH51_18975, partial [Myxococcota bacterium]|nr:hypothetical protein [Myxococcota bacterium]